MTITNILIFFAQNIALILSSLFIAAKIYKYKVEGLSKFILSVFTIFVSQIVIIEIVLGIIGKISYENILILTALSLITTGILFGKETWNKLSTGPVSSKPSVLTIYIVFLPLLCIFLIRAFSAMFQVPLEYDVVAYHLPFVVEWMNTKSLMDIYYSAFASPIGYYPSNYELLNLWTIIPFRNDILVNILNFPLMIFLGITINKILKNLSVQKNTALILTGALFYIPIFIRQGGTGLTDIFFCLTFALSIYFLQEIYKYRTNPFKANSIKTAYVLFGLNTGLLVGTKYLGLIIATIPIILFLLISLYPSAQKKIRDRLKLIGISAISSLLTGGFFYIRNWISSGNPLFPVDLNIFGWKIFEGYLGTNEKLLNTSLAENLNDLAGTKSFLVQYYNLIGLPGTLAVLSIIGVLGILIYKLFKKNSKEDLIMGTVLLASSIIYIYLYIKTPFSYSHIPQNTRYSMPFLIIGIMNIGFIYSKAKAIKPLFDLGVFIAIFYTLFLMILHPSNGVELTDRVILDTSLINDYPGYFFTSSISLIALISGIYLLFTMTSGKRKNVTIISLLIVSAIVRIPIVTFAETEREKLVEHTRDTLQRDEKIKSKINAAIYLDKTAELSKIAYTGFNYHYLLFGRKMQREVDYININECGECRYGDYKSSEKSIRRDPSFENWFKNLKEKNKEYLVLDIDQAKEEYDWALSHPKNFVQTFSETSLKIYKITY